jgi:hypothetical protein
VQLKTEMRIEGTRAHPERITSHRFRYRSESKKHDVRKWLAEGEAAFDEAVSAGIDDAARRMREDIRATLRP